MKTIYKKLIFIILIIFPIICLPQSNGIIEIIEDIGDDNTLIRLETDSGMLISESIIRFGLDSNNYQFSSIYENNYTPLNSFGDDILESTVWMPGEQTGIHPRDVIYNATNNKYYLYGGRRVVIIDASTNTITNTITVSDVASISPSTSITAIPVQKRLAYNTLHNKLYCSTENMELVVIDCTPGQEEEIIETISVNLCNVLSTSIVYNELYDKVYWVLNQSNDYKYIKVYDGGVGNTFLFEESYWYLIQDIIINSTGNKVFISNGHKIIMLNANNLEEIAHYQIGGVEYAGNLVYNSVLDKLYCQIFETNMITVLDGNTCSFLSNINSTAYRGFRSCFNNIYNKVYFTCKDEQNQNKIIIIDCYNDIEICSYDLIYSFPVIFDNNNKIYCGGKELTSIDGDDNSIICNCNLAGGLSKGLAYSQIENKIISTNLMEGTAPILNPDCQIEELIKVGGNIILGCYNSTYNKVYFPQSSVLNEVSFLSIIDGETNQYIDQLDIGCNITSCAYNVENDYLYVGIDSWSEKAVKKIDGYTNEIINTFQLNTNPLRIYSGNGDNVYVGGVNRIIVINAESNQINEIELPWISIVTDFAEDIEKNRIFTCLDNTNKVVGIDGSTLTILDMIDVGDNPFGIVYNDISEINKLYCINYSSGTVSIINVDNNNNYNIINTLPTLGAPISIAFSKRSNKIYVLGDLGITVIDGNNDENILSTIILENDMYAFSLIYNPVNNKIYVHKMFGNPNSEMLVYVLDCETDEVCSTISLEQYQQLGIFQYSTPEYEKMVYNTNNNKIYSCNHYFSNVSVIQCAPDQLPLRSGWTWLSFPRLERDGNDPVYAPDVLGNINEDYSYLKMTNIPPQQIDEVYIVKEDGQWNTSGGLEYVQSTKGYKLYIEPEGVRTISLYGTVLDPSTQMNLYAGYANWIGFFPEQTITVSDAFSSIWDNISEIRHQDWAIANPPNNQPPVPDYMLNFTLSYGDMVIVRVWEDCTFQWPSNADPETPLSAPETQYFTYDKAADYTPFYVEMNPDSLPVEISIYEDTTCVGASVVQDSVVEINGYLTDSAGYNPEISFVSYYASRSAPKAVKKYHVYNFDKGKMEQRTIHSKDKADYYWISLKGGSAYEDEEIETSGDIKFKVYPNPFSNQTQFIYEIKKQTKVGLYIYDTKGMRVTTLIDGKQTSGTYKLAWNGKNDSGKTLQPGIYYYKFFANGLNKNGKLVIIE